jgi:hypothetical protein
MEGVKLTSRKYDMINVDVEETVTSSPPRNCGSHKNNEDILELNRNREYISHLNP